MIKKIEPFEIIEKLEPVIVKSEPVKEPKKEVVYFRETLWSGVVPTFRCETCGSCEPDKDEMILHVLTHVPERDRDNLLEKLTKE